VKKGDPLFTIDQRPYRAALEQAEALVASAQVRVEFASNDLERAESLRRSGNIAEQEQNSAAALESWSKAMAADPNNVRVLESIARLMRPGGLAALQFISIREPLFDSYAASADFIQTYIFPGGMLLSEARFEALAKDVGLEWQGRIGFGRHYAETLRRWRKAYDEAVAAGRLPSGFDEPFHRLWRYYLMYCEGGFRGGGIDVAQVTLSKPAAAGTRAVAKAFEPKGRTE